MMYDKKQLEADYFEYLIFTLIHAFISFSSLVLAEHLIANSYSSMYEQMLSENRCYRHGSKDGGYELFAAMHCIPARIFNDFIGTQVMN